MKDKRPLVCVCGQLPPPVHGQAVLIRALLDGSYSRLRLRPVRMAFSGRLDEVGRFSLRKVAHLLPVAARLLAARLRGARVLYYPPAGPGRVPFWRDIALLLPVRFLFPRVVYHFHIAGLAATHASLSPFSKWLFRLAYGRPDAAIYLSAHSPDDAAPMHPRLRRVVHNGVPDQAAALPARRRAEGAPPSILYVGSLSREKGLLALLEAFRLLRDRGAAFRGVLAGEWRSAAFRAECLAFLEKADLNGAVRLAGPIAGEAKWRTFAEADLFAYPSLVDNFPLAIVEAMMAGLPVVATDLYGMKEQVVEGETGFLTPAGDAAALADRMEPLLADPARRRALGEAGRARYERHFTLDAWRKRMEDVLAEIAEAP